MIRIQCFVENDKFPVMQPNPYNRQVDKSSPLRILCYGYGCLNVVAVVLGKTVLGFGRVGTIALGSIVFATRGKSQHVSENEKRARNFSAMLCSLGEKWNGDGVGGKFLFYLSFAERILKGLDAGVEKRG